MLISSRQSLEYLLKGKVFLAQAVEALRVARS
jgi:hypothetical protein